MIENKFEIESFKFFLSSSNIENFSKKFQQILCFLKKNTLN